MKVYVQGKKVQTKRLVSCLHRTRLYNYASKTFRSRAELEANRAREEAKTVEFRARESESKLKCISRTRNMSI